MERMTADRVSDPLIGRLLDGRYRVGPRVARGGMATVYEATDNRLDRTVALKVMHPDWPTTTSSSAASVREAQVGRPARRTPTWSPSTTRATTTARCSWPWSTSRGITLRDLIRTEAPMSPVRALTVIEPVLSALGAAHRAGMIHRDVKPENVLLADDGRVKVADFGLARAVTRAQHTDHRRADGHGRLPLPRAGHPRPRRRPLRRLRRRHPALRDAHRPEAVRGRHADPGRLPARARRRPAAVAADARSRRTSTRWSPAPPPATPRCARPTPLCCSTSSAGCATRSNTASPTTRS